MSLSFLIAAYYGFYFAAMAVFVIYAPPALATLGFSPWHIGILLSITPLVRFLSPFLLSKQEINAALFKKGLLGSLICVAIAPLVVFNFWVFCIYFFVFSIFWIVGLPFIDALAMRHIGKEQYGKIRLFGSIGFSICALIMGELDISVLVLWLSYFALYAVAVVIGIKISANESFQADDLRTEKIDILHNWRFWASILAFQLSFGAFYSFYSIYSLEHGFSKAQIGYLWTFGVFCEILMFWLQAPIVKRFDSKRLFLIATAFAIPRWAIVWLYPQNIYLAFFAQSLHAFNLALYMTAAFDIISKRYINIRLAKLYFYGLGYGLGGFIGSLIAGEIYGNNLFAFCMICAIIATLFLVGDKKCDVLIATHK